MSQSAIIRRIKRLFKENGDPVRKTNYEKYFKGVVEMHGVTAKVHREKIFRPVYNEDIKELKLNKQLKLAYKLLESKNQDEKKIGGMILNKNVKKIFNKGEKFLDEFFEKMEEIIDEYVYDWATADQLASKVFHDLIKLSEDGEIEEKIEEWKDAVLEEDEEEYSGWRQRIACVSFVKLARHGDHDDVIIRICKKAVRNDFRFTQLGVGWVLRELSLADLDRVVKFIKKNYNRFIREGLRYAIEKMKNPLRKELLDYKKITGKKRKRNQSKVVEEDDNEDCIDDEIVKKPRRKRSKRE